ncbi:hypothetical protein IEE94_11080 [Yimella sp. cx-573]|nr:hypothetical protein [Yimella sp. cx-573]
MSIIDGRVLLLAATLACIAWIARVLIRDHHAATQHEQHMTADEAPVCVLAAIHDAPLGAWLAHVNGACECRDDLDHELSLLLDQEQRPYDHEKEGI